MGEAKRRKQKQGSWAEGSPFRGAIELHTLPPSPKINGARIRELTGDDSFLEAPEIILRTFRASVGNRSFLVGFCLGDGEKFSAIGIAVIERLMVEASGVPLHIVPVFHEDVAWDVVLRHLRTFSGKVIIFAFPNSSVYDAGTAEIHYSKCIRQFDPNGREVRRLTSRERHDIRKRAAAMLRQPPPTLYPAAGIEREDAPWIFGFVTPAGKSLRVAVWNGRRDCAHELPEDIHRFVGGDRIAIVQVDRPVGVDRRSALGLTYHLSDDFDGIVHWARDTETFQSILQSFVRLDFESVGPANPPRNWQPVVTIFAANEDPVKSDS